VLHADPQPEHNKKCIDVPVKYADALKQFDPGSMRPSTQDIDNVKWQCN